MARTKFIPQRDYHPDPRGVDLRQQTEIYEQWSAVMVAIHCDYKEGSLMDLKKEIGRVAAAGMSVAEQDERLVLPGTLVSAYMRLCGKTDEELQKVELHHIRPSDPRVLSSLYRDRLVNEAYIARHRSGKALWSAYTKPKPPLQCMSVRRLPLPGATMDKPLKTKARTRRHKSASARKASSSALPVQGSGK